MAGGWLDITDGDGTRREPLKSGRTILGGRGADVSLSHVGNDCLHVWDDPPRALHVGEGDAPRVNGRPFDETPLTPGDRIQWFGRSLVYGGTAAPSDQAVLEEIPVEELAGPPSAAGTHAGTIGAELGRREVQIWRRLIAGLALEQGLAENKVAKRWRDQVVAGHFDPDACADEILISERVKRDDDVFLHRSGRLLRDFLMAPMLSGARGAGRRARRAARGGLAFVLAQGLALFVLATILFAAMVLLRLRGVSFDEALDRVLFR